MGPSLRRVRRSPIFRDSRFRLTLAITPAYDNRAGIGIAFGLLGLLGAMLHFHVFGLIIVGIRLAINGAIIWYLLQPHVKAAFQARAAAAPAR